MRCGFLFLWHPPVMSIRLKLSFASNICLRTWKLVVWAETIKHTELFDCSFAIILYYLVWETGAKFKWSVLPLLGFLPLLGLGLGLGLWVRPLLRAHPSVRIQQQEQQQQQQHRSCCCLHIKSFVLPNDVISTPSVRPDSSSHDRQIQIRWKPKNNREWIKVRRQIKR